ncbi:MAG: FMN-binding protein [Pseudomonadales bacterium]|jgi:electron transport complex protein RnfG
MKDHTSVFTILTGVAMLCGFAIALVYQATAEQIAHNRTARLEEAVARVLPGGVTRFQGYRAAGAGIAPAGIDQAAFIAGYDSNGAFTGVAVPVSIMGYQDTIGMLLGYDPQQQQLTGFAVLESRETPGLGAKIATDPAFLASLGALDVTLAGAALANPVVLSRGIERRPHEVDGITGATVSSSAVVRAVNNAAPDFAAIRARLGVLLRTTENRDAG